MSADRLKEIKEEMEGLLNEAKHIVQTECRKFTYTRAKAYWIGAIENAIGSPLNGEATIDEAISELEDKEADNEGEETDE
jgi:hypothetical protein